MYNYESLNCSWCS